jgi:hypothetical protein
MVDLENARELGEKEENGKDGTSNNCQSRVSQY